MRPPSPSLPTDHPLTTLSEIFKTLTSTTIPYIRSNPALASSLQIIVRHQIQPWHPSSTLTHEAALAVQRIAPSKFWDFSAALFENQLDFFDKGVIDEPRHATYRRLAKLAAESVGVDEGEVYDLLKVEFTEGGPKNAGNQVTNDVKLVVKMARLVGVHVSPTVLFDGVVANEISSGWTGEQWQEWLGKNVV